MRSSPGAAVPLRLPAPRNHTADPLEDRSAPDAHSAGGRWAAQEALDVVVEGELVGMRAQPDGIDLVLPLVLDPRLDEIRGEHVALEEEGVVLLQVVEHDVERAGELLDLLLL